MFRVLVVITPGSSWLAAALLTEPWRLANEIVADRTGPAVAHTVRSWDGEPVELSNGMQLPTDGRCDTADPEVDAVVVLASESVAASAPPELIGWLREMGRGSALIAGVDAGPDLLARAGLLSDHVAAIHHEALPGFREQYLGLQLSYGRYSLDESRATCAGSATTLDFSLALLGRFAGPALAAQTADRLIYTPQVDPAAPREAAAPWLDDRLRRAMHVISGDSAEPGVIARAADAAGVSDRHLHRLFVDELGVSPRAFALELRMRRARTLLAETPLAVTSVARACGYSSASDFSRAVSRRYGRAPTELRRSLRGGPVSKAQSKT